MTTLKIILVGSLLLGVGTAPLHAQTAVLQASAFGSGAGVAATGAHQVRSTVGPTASPSVLGTADVLHGVGFWFAVRSTDTVLPVEWTDFAARADGEAVLLTWRTASETNNAGFAVEQHQAADGTWRSVGFVEGAGTTTEPQRYRYRVADPGLGAHRFRLRQVDLDGAFAYSEEVEVAVALAEPFRVSPVYPNPVAGWAAVDVAVREGQPIRAELYDLLGRRVATVHDGPVAPNRALRMTVDGRALASGMYLLHVAGPDFAVTRRLTIVR
jgi:hypothetical protein